MLMRAEKLMSTPLYFVKPGDDIVAAIGLMLKHEIGRVSVVDEGKLVGLVDRYDMIKSYLGE
jgi:CBS domain-containing protein